MIGFLPTPLPDELVHSVVARYRARTGMSVSLVRRLFFGADYERSVHLPVGLQHLVQRLPYGHAITLDALVEQHTLYPVFAPFLGPHRAASLLNGMARGIRREVVGVQLPPALRYCLECLEEDRASHGEAYWHRSHQAPGVTVCAIHQTYLQTCEVRDPIELPADQLLGSRYSAPANRRKPRLHEVYLSREVSSLLHLRVQPIPPDRLRAHYRSLCIDRGIVNPIGSRINGGELRARFIDHYGVEFLEAVGCSVPDEYGHWLVRFVRSGRPLSPDPVRHLLFMGFLGEPAGVFLQRASQCEPNLRPRATWESRLRKLWSQPEISSTDLARRLGVDWKTVKRHAKRLGMGKRPIPNRQVKYGQGHGRPETIAKHREQWLSAMKCWPEAGMTELRRRLPGTFAYLRKYDLHWLEANKPAQRPPRVDWAQRDRNLSQLVRSAAVALKQMTSPPVRVTKRALGNFLGNTALTHYTYAQHRQKHPLTAKALDQVVETPEEFARRRSMLSHEPESNGR